MSNFKAWAKDVALRAVKTAAQASVALVTANTAGLTHLDFAVVAYVAAMAAFVCVLQNLSNLKVPDPALLPAVYTTAATGTLVKNVTDPTFSVDANGHMRIDWKSGKAMYWDEAAQSFKMDGPTPAPVVPPPAVPDPTQPAPSP